jgi:hypothetical protein
MDESRRHTIAPAQNTYTGHLHGVIQGRKRHVSGPSRVCLPRISENTWCVCVSSHGAPVSAAQHHSACRGHLLEVNTYCPRAVPATYVL